LSISAITHLPLFAALLILVASFVSISDPGFDAATKKKVMLLDPHKR